LAWQLGWDISPGLLGSGGKCVAEILENPMAKMFRAYSTIDATTFARGQLGEPVTKDEFIRAILALGSFQLETLSVATTMITDRDRARAHLEEATRTMSNLTEILLQMGGQDVARVLGAEFGEPK
jgi:hypothetical protein